MNFWEDFFSTDKIIYPAIGALLAGFLILIITLIFKFTVTDMYIGICMACGFIIGNTIKANKLEEIRKLKIKKENKNKAKRK